MAGAPARSSPAWLGALLEAARHGLRMLPGVRLDRLPRMADFALWTAACKTALWPVGTFARAYERNRSTAIEDAIDADPVAPCVRAFMAERGSWTGSAANLRDDGDPISNGPARSPAACVAPRPSARLVTMRQVRRAAREQQLAKERLAGPYTSLAPAKASQGRRDSACARRNQG